MQLGGRNEGRLIRAQTTQSKRISCKGEPASGWLEVSPEKGRSLAFTRYCLIYEACVHESILLFANTTFVWAPRCPVSLHTLLRKRLVPLDDRVLQYIPFNIVNGNIV